MGLKCRASLQTLLVVPFILEIFIAVGLTGWLAFTNGQVAVNDLATQLRGEISERIQERLQTYLSVPHRVNQLNANSLFLNELNISQFSERTRHFWKQVHTFDLISHNYMGLPDGGYFGAKRLQDGSFQVMQRNPETGANEYFAVDDDGQKTEFVTSALDYDPRQRPWYQAALDAGKPTWSQIYSDFTTRGLAITAVNPVYKSNGQLQGVLGSSLILSWVNDFLSSLKIGKTGRTFIMERNGLLVATSNRTPLLKASPTGELERILAIHSSNNLIRSAAEDLEQRFQGDLSGINADLQLNFKIDGERQFLQVSPLHDQWGLDWLIVVVVPESDFMENINAITRNTLLLCGVALLLGLFGGVFTSRLVIKPILHLNSIAKSLASGNWNQTVNFDRKDELGELGRSFQSMAEQLRASFEELETKNADLRKLDKLKDEFLANTSHELRTPLNGIVGIAESLYDGAAGDLSETQRRNILMIVQSGYRLTNLVNDILDFSKLKHKSLELNLRPIGMREIVEVVLTLSQPLVGQKDLVLVNAISPDLPPAHADENRLQQILYNLIGNGIKFSESGYVEVSARIISGAEPALNFTDTGSIELLKQNERYLEICIADTGIGISEAQLESIFESFEQGDGSTAREYGGTGLGLTVTKQLVELHRGAIWAASEHHKGSKFYFTLPVSLQQAEPMQKDVSQLSREALMAENPVTAQETIEISADAFNTEDYFRILIVDDEPVNRQVLINHLSLHQYVTKQAQDGLEALSIMEEGFEPNLILLDVMMPKMTGYEVCRRLRKQYPANELPIIMLTAKNQVANMVEGLDAGANDYLTKPVSKNELLARIKTHIELCNINLAYGRFVPHQFIQLMDKQSVVDVKLGDHVEKEMTILFSDIRGFTTMSEAMSPQENFDFINAYLSRMEPVIGEHEGFIDKYIGDAIMALFPSSVDHAVQAAIGMLLRLTEYNTTRGRPGRPVLRIGIGLHTGLLMLGTVGGKNRMDGTVIADAVNLASRTEGLTKTYGCALLITEKTYQGLADPEQYKIRVIDRVKVKGKTEAVTVYEIFDADSPALRELKLLTLADFEEGFSAYHRQDMLAAEQAFSRVLALNAEDRAAQVYLERCHSCVTPQSDSPQGKHP